MNTEQIAAVTGWLCGRTWHFMGKNLGALGYTWIVCNQVSHYFLFDTDNKIVDVKTD